MILIRSLGQDDNKMHSLTRTRWMKIQLTGSKLIITYLTKTCFKMKKKLKMEKEDLLMNLLTIELEKTQTKTKRSMNLMR